MSVRTLAFLAFCLFPATLRTQAPDPAAAIARARAALTPVQRLVGRWEGEARVVEGPGGPRVVRQSEDIVLGAAGSVVFIRGTGRDPVSGSIVFEAAASLWFDAESNRLRMRTHRDGRSLDPDVEVRPDTLIWSFALPAGRMRYVIALTDSTWHETGVFERTGSPAVRTMDMHLRRTAR